MKDQNPEFSRFCIESIRFITKELKIVICVFYIRKLRNFMIVDNK